MSPSLISAVPSVYRGPGRVSRSRPDVASVRASASVVLFDVPSARARSLRDCPSGGPSATISISRMARATLRTVYRLATSTSPPLTDCTRAPPRQNVRLYRTYDQKAITLLDSTHRSEFRCLCDSISHNDVRYNRTSSAKRCPGGGGASARHRQTRKRPIGFAQREFEITPGQHASRWYAEPIMAGHAVAWNPSLPGGGWSEDTYLVSAGGVRQRVSISPGWPTEPDDTMRPPRPAVLEVGT